MMYRTIVADPPWPMPETGRRTTGPTDAISEYVTASGRRKKGEWWARFTDRTVVLPYSPMSLGEIRGLPVADLADKNAHLYLWTTNRFLKNAYDVAREWGFRPSQLLVWCKPPMGIGFGGTFVTTTEFCVFARRGTLKAQCRIDSTWFNWSRVYENGHVAHSAKPEAFIDMVERVSPGPYLELFARRQRLGWDTWGNECFNHVDLLTEVS